MVNLVVFVLCSKTTNMYRRVFEAIKEATKGSWKPAASMSDFEQAISNAVKESFPGIDCRYCYFHYLQAIDRKLSSEYAGKFDAKAVREICRSIANAVDKNTYDVLLKQLVDNSSLEFMMYHNMTFIGLNNEIAKGWVQYLWNNSTYTAHNCCK